MNGVETNYPLCKPVKVLIYPGNSISIRSQLHSTGQVAPTTWITNYHGKSDVIVQGWDKSVNIVEPLCTRFKNSHL